jgi:DNA-binding transcriptional regulator YiaG
MMASIHETAEDLYEAGLMEKRTMREFNKLCLNCFHWLKKIGFRQ